MSKFCVHSNVGVSLISATGELFPCCKFNSLGSVKNIYDVTTLNELHNTPHYKHIQDELNNGVFPHGCGYCENAEATNVQSRRQYTNELYKNERSYVPGYVQDLEIALDYTCNMMCRSCNPATSSKWNIAKTVISEFIDNGIEIDSKNMYKSYQDQFYTVINNTDLSHARVVKIQGGEPFYAKNLEWFIDKLDREVIDKTKLHLDIFTNGSIFPNNALLKKLSNLNAGICFSIDAYGDLASTIRWGVDWNTIEKNIRKWHAVSLEHSNIRLLSNITVSLLNVNKLQPLLDFCNSLNIQLHFSELTFPGYLSIFQLPKKLRNQWTYKNKSLNELIMLDMSIDLELDKLLKSIDILDRYQGISFKQTNSEMYQLIQSLSPC